MNPINDISQIHAIERASPHIWCIDISKCQDSLRFLKRQLSVDEVDRAHKFRFAKDRITFTVMRATLRKLLSIYLGSSIKSIQIRYNKFGKPEIQYPPTNVHFNVSHAGHMGIIGFSLNVPIGVDIENIKYTQDLDLVAKKFFSKNEYKSYLSLPIKDKPVGFFNCWTRKESFIKAIGEGLSFPLKKFDISLSPGKPAKLEKTYFDEEEKYNWTVREIEVPKGYISAFAIRMRIINHKMYYLNSDALLLS